MTTATGTETSIAEIRRLSENWAAALSRRDIDAMLTHYSDAVVAFDVPPPLQIKGRETVRQYIENWLGMFNGPVQMEYKDLSITAGEDVAFIHTLAKLSQTDAPESGSWVRVTVCYQKIDGQWLVTHEHASVPFNGQESVTGLSPE